MQLYCTGSSECMCKQAHIQHAIQSPNIQDTSSAQQQMLAADTELMEYQEIDVFSTNQKLRIVSQLGNPGRAAPFVLTFSVIEDVLLVTLQNVWFSYIAAATLFLG